MALVQSEKYDPLVQWWRESCRSFSLHYLLKSDEERHAWLLKCCPDMPNSSSSRNTEEVKATDFLLPELSMKGLEEGNGRSLILFLTRRLASPDTGLGNDLDLLRTLYTNGIMPTFSNGALVGHFLPFVDPKDPSEQIQSIAETAECVHLVRSSLASGSLIHAEVYLATCIRRAQLADFILALKNLYDEEMSANDTAPEEVTSNMSLS